MFWIIQSMYGVSLANISSWGTVWCIRHSTALLYIFAPWQSRQFTLTFTSAICNPGVLQILILRTVGCSQSLDSKSVPYWHRYNWLDHTYFFQSCLYFSGYFSLLRVGGRLQSQLQCIPNWPVVWVHIFDVKLLRRLQHIATSTHYVY